MKYEDPVSLSILHQPITVKGSDPKHSYSRAIIDEMTKTSKIDPLTQTVLEPDWRIEDLSLDKELSEAMGCLSLTNGGTVEPVFYGHRLVSGILGVNNRWS